MPLRTALRRTARLAGVAGGIGLAAAAAANDPAPLPPVVRPAGLTTPPRLIPPADAPPVKPLPSVAKVSVSATTTAGTDALPAALADARAAYAKVRDYACHLVRQERVNGVLLPEQTAELRVRAEPLCVNVRTVAPKEFAGEETSYVAARSAGKVQFRRAGVDGVKYGFQALSPDDPRALAHTRHAAPDTGLKAVLDRVEKAVRTERQLNHPVQVLAADYTYAGRPCRRFEVFAERAHPNRYAHRMVLYVDKGTRLPVRFEAYDQPRGGSGDGELIEVQSFVGLRLNVGLGDAAFER